MITANTTSDTFSTPSSSDVPGRGQDDQSPAPLGGDPEAPGHTLGRAPRSVGQRRRRRFGCFDRSSVHKRTISAAWSRRRLTTRQPRQVQLPAAAMINWAYAAAPSGRRCRSIGVEPLGMRRTDGRPVDQPDVAELGRGRVERCVVRCLPVAWNLVGQQHDAAPIGQRAEHRSQLGRLDHSVVPRVDHHHRPESALLVIGDDVVQHQVRLPALDRVDAGFRVELDERG